MSSRRTLVILSALLLLQAPAPGGNWPQWRGRTGDSVSAEQGLPLEWAENKNVLWKCPLPGAGASTPAVWGDALFVTCQKGEGLLLVKIGKNSGKIAWERTAGAGTLTRSARQPRGQQKFHKLHNLASPSPVTDGRRIVAHFGNGDLAAYDFDGKQLWHHNLQKEHGAYTNWWGHANSPVLYKDLVIAVAMQDSLEDLGEPRAESYLVAYDLKTGARRWKTFRNTGAASEAGDAYTTPVLAEIMGQAEMLVMGANHLDAYDPLTGKRLWYLPGLNGNRTITGPTVADGLVYATCGMHLDLVAIKLGARGELPKSAIVWRTKDGTPDSSCPVVSKGLIFFISDNGFAQCRDAKTGALKWKERFPGDHKASPLAAEGRIYFLSRNGRCTVAGATAKWEKLAENRLDDEFIASPAVSDGKLYLRGQKAVYCIGSR